jgi:hypothetical protein
MRLAGDSAKHGCCCCVDDAVGGHGWEFDGRLLLQKPVLAAVSGLGVEEFFPEPGGGGAGAMWCALQRGNRGVHARTRAASQVSASGALSSKVM